MLKYIFAFIIFIHGFIHLLGFAKAFGYGNITQLTKDISKLTGSIWLFAFMLFVIIAIGFLMKKDWWAVLALFAVVISEVVIIMSWKDAKFGTIANVIILITAILAWAGIQFERN